MSSQSDAIAIHRQRLRDHSAQILDVAVDAPWVEVRSRLLTRLEADDFVPELQIDVARRVLQNPACEERTVMAGVYEHALREEIEAMAGDWFQLSISERKERWYRLVERAGNYPRLLARLKQLQAGITFDAPPAEPANPRCTIDELAALCGEQVVARPIAAALSRQLWLERSDIDEKSRVKAVARFASRSPQLAQLAPDCLKLLRQTDAQLKKLGRWHARKRKFKKEWSAIWIVVLVVGGFFIGGVSEHYKYKNTKPKPKPKPPARVQKSGEQLIMEAVRAGRLPDYRIVPDADGFGEHLEKIEKTAGPPPTEHAPKSMSAFDKLLQQYKAEKQARESQDAKGQPGGAEQPPEIDPDVAAIIDGLVPNDDASPPADDDK